MITLVGDLHVKKDNIQTQELLFENICENISRKHIILTGDLLDTKSIIRSECLNFLYNIFSKYSDLEFHIIVGNHDQHYLGTLECSLKPLEALPNVHIYDTLIEVEIEGLNFEMIPYIHDHLEFENLVNSVKNQKDKILVCHQGLSNFDYGNGKIAQNESDIKCISKFKRVYIGHFHKYQEFKNGCYIGTPFSQSFGESNQDKFIGIIQKDGKLELRNTEFPRHMTYRLDCEVESGFPAEFKELDMNRVFLEGSLNSISKFKADNSQALESCKVLERPTIQEVESGVEIDETLSNVSKFEKWALEIGALDLETVKLGTKILETLR
jgi:DNA repair exonuclease SbcCD nuclease subunit